MIEKPLSFKDAQSILGVSRTLLRKLVINQEIEYTMMGHRKIYFTEKGIQEYLDRRTVKPKTVVEEPTVIGLIASDGETRKQIDFKTFY